jgi:aprataxin
MTQFGYPSYSPPDKEPPKNGYRWMHALAKFKEFPAKWAEWIYLDAPEDELMVVYDGYAKAAVHLLVLPMNEYLPQEVSQFERHHLICIKKIHNIARGIADQIDNESNIPLWKCKIGYHAKPSMDDLHIHIITQDFDSERLKNKKHWNSYNTDFFVSIDKVESDLEEFGQVQLPDEEELKVLIKQPLYCHRCETEFKTLPKLKLHLKEPCVM